MGITVAVIGASGYTGVQIVEILLRHPKVQIKALSSHTQPGKPVSMFMGINAPEMEYCSIDSEEVDKCDVIFSCMPHGTSFANVADWAKKGKVVIDLSANFRLKDSRTFYLFYGITHPELGLLAEAVYGMPEINREELKKANVIASPGCYPTAITLGLLPAMKVGWLEKDFVISAVSGISGAGRTAKGEFHYCEVNENMSAYAAPKHRHTPEIEQNLSILSGDDVRVSFVPQLGPFNRGIYATIFSKTKVDRKQEEAVEIYKAFFEKEPFVTICDHFPKLKDVRGTNYCHIKPVIDDRTGRLIVLSALDNLVKGAGGQAVQCFNIRFGFEETEGLTTSFSV